jgi:hypothetical protein
MARRRSSTRFYFRLGRGFGMSTSADNINNPFATGILIGALQGFSRNPLIFLLFLPIFLPIILVALALELLTPLIQFGARQLGSAIGYGTVTLFKSLSSRPTKPAALVQHESNPPPIIMQNDLVLKLLGTITWLNPENSKFERYQVTRAIYRHPAEMVIDVDTGDANNPYIYTITLQCMADSTITGEFSGGVGNDKSTGSVTGQLYQAPFGYVITGIWVENSIDFTFFSELAVVNQFPDELEPEGS